MALELFEGIRLAVDALELEARGWFTHQSTLPGLALAQAELRVNTDQRRHQHRAPTPNAADTIRLHVTELTPSGLLDQAEMGDS